MSIVFKYNLNYNYVHVLISTSFYVSNKVKVNLKVNKELLYRCDPLLQQYAKDGHRQILKGQKNIYCRRQIQLLICCRVYADSSR